MSLHTFDSKEIFMSHIVTIKTQIRDPAALAAACQRLGLAQPTVGTARLYSWLATGLIVQLPGWRYPVVANVQTGVFQASMRVSLTNDGPVTILLDSGPDTSSP